jgi:hypothetical protein
MGPVMVGCSSYLTTTAGAAVFLSLLAVAPGSGLRTVNTILSLLVILPQGSLFVNVRGYARVQFGGVASAGPHPFSGDVPL